VAIKSVYWPECRPGASAVEVTGDEHQHLRVSRTEKGETLELFDGAGHVWSGQLVELDRRSARIRILDEWEIPAPEAQVWLGQALIKASAFEIALEKAVEVGVTRVIPFRASRSNAGDRDRSGRWKRIIVEASKQSKHYHVPQLDPVAGFDDVLSIDAPTRLICSERGGGRLDNVVGSAPVLYLIGPEGGWTETELDAAGDAGVQPVRLGGHILRSETAAIVAGGLITHHLGVL
jgi:16S rRNA (uracil1498-N3)-methyltransferase